MNKSCAPFNRFIIRSLFLILCLSTQGFSQQSTVKDGKASGDMTLHNILQSHIDLTWWWRYRPDRFFTIF